MKYINLATALAAVVLLNGCLEVEDNNSDIQALLDQRDNSDVQALLEQSTVSIKGVVVDAFDLKPIDNALITVKVGSTEILSNVEVTMGEFELTGLPEYSDIDLIITSPDNKFLSRTFFTQTFDGSSDGIRDFGTFAVSESVDIEISVIDTETNTAFSTLEFVGFSHSGTNSSAFKYQHVSTFNADNGIYTITLPKYINTSVSANLDFDKNGEIDYEPELYNQLRDRDLYVGFANTKEFSTIHLNKVADESETDIGSDLEIRLSLVDETAQPVLGASFYIEDMLVKSTYDELKNQYIISTKIEESLTLQIPEFTVNDTRYQSSAVTIIVLADGNLSIRKSSNYNHYSNCCIDIPNTNVIDFAISPQVVLESDTPIEVVLAASEVNTTDFSFSVFYSQAIEVKAENIALTNTGGFTVVRGSDEENDLILPGNTIITSGISIPFTFALSLNNTRLKITPDAILSKGELYNYNVKSVINQATLENSDVDYDTLNFKLKDNEDAVFSVADIKLDNENYTTNGDVIISQNSAGEFSNSINRQRSVMLYFPTSINSLQNLNLRQLSYVKNGISSVDIENIYVVVDGQIRVSEAGIVNLAENENIVREYNTRYIITQSAQPETQKLYRYRGNIYASDNTVADENTVSYEYSYETKAGEVSTGTITIPVQ